MIVMLVESVIANLSAEEGIGDSIDWLDLTWMDCRRRFARKQTRSGREVRLLLRLGQQLKHGDLLGYWPEAKVGQRRQAVVVNLLVTEVFVVRLGEATHTLTISYEIGNLHEPMQLTATELLMPASHGVQVMLNEREVAYSVERRIFQPTHWPALVQLAENLQIMRR
jgi:urease accessory protein UreE